VSPCSTEHSGIWAPLVPLLAEWIGWSGSIASGSVVILLGTLMWVFIRVDSPLEPATHQTI
jgi:hypothetical protein